MSDSEKDNIEVNYKNNCKIAKFLGFTSVKSKSLNANVWSGEMEDPWKTRLQGVLDIKNNLKFDHDYNWLMDALQTIPNCEKIKNKKYHVQFFLTRFSSISIRDNNSNLIFRYISPSLDWKTSMYDVLVNFVEWYNKLK